MNNQTPPQTSTSLRIVRRFNVAPDVVFDTFTQPELMCVWWTQDTHFEVSLRVGGHWTITRQEGDTTYTMTGVYLEVKRPHRLRYTISMPQFSPNSDTITIDLAGDARGGCEMIFVQSGVDIAEELKAIPAGSVSESETGWQQGFDLMAAAWDRLGLSAQR